MLQDTDAQVRRDALTNRCFRPPADLVPGLLADDTLRLQAISRIPLVADVARTLVSDEDPQVRRAVAANPDLARDLMELLVADPDDSVRRALMERPEVPFEVLETIEYDLDPMTRTYPVEWLWQQRHDTDLLSRYARSRHVIYRRTVAHVPGLPPDLVSE